MTAQNGSTMPWKNHSRLKLMFNGVAGRILDRAGVKSCHGIGSGWIGLSSNAPEMDGIAM